MIESQEPTARRTGAGLGAALESSASILGAGVLSLVGGGFIGARWLSQHRDHWGYNVTLSYSPILRNSLTAVALISGLIATVALLDSARRNVPVHGRRLYIYWAATAFLWVTLAAMAFMSVDIRLSGVA